MALTEVNSLGIKDLEVKTADIAAANVTLAKVADVTDGQIIVGNGSNRPTAVAVSGDVTLANTGAVSIADNAVDLAAMAHGTDGNLITYDTNGAPDHVATGTSGHVLTSNGAGAAPTFQAAATVASDKLTHSSSDRVVATADVRTFTDTLVMRNAANNSDIATYEPTGIDWYHSGTKVAETSANGLAFPSGKGIDFSAQTAGTGTGVSTSVEVLKHYEEGSWTPSMDGLSNTPSFYNNVGKYTKIGNIVKCQGFIQIGATKPTFTTDANVFYVSGLPFAISAVGYGGVIGNVMWQQIDWVGASRSTYGQSNDTQITVGVESSTKCNFRTCGQNKYYMGQLKNLVFGEGDGWILEWDMTYYTSA